MLKRMKENRVNKKEMMTYHFSTEESIKDTDLKKVRVFIKKENQKQIPQDWGEKINQNGNTYNQYQEFQGYKCSIAWLKRK